MEPPQGARNHALPWFGRPVSEMALTAKKGGSSAGSPGKRKRKRKGDPAKAGGSVATKRNAAKAAGRKGPTDGVTEGSSGSFRRHAQREKQPGQRLMHSLSSEISDFGNEQNKQRKSGVTQWKQQTYKREKERRKLLKDSCRTVSCHARRVRRAKGNERGKKGRRRNLLDGVRTNGVWSRRSRRVAPNWCIPYQNASYAS